ncbi:DUF3558 domain-containing protein (plasmid) [Streptomycetaceae bacterium NBC_01309]
MLLATGCSDDSAGGDAYGGDSPGQQTTASDAASPKGSEAPPTPSPSDAAGKAFDGRTTDPCSVVTREALAPFAAQPSQPPPLPNGKMPPPRPAVMFSPGTTIQMCRIQVQLRQGSAADVRVSLGDKKADSTTGRPTGEPRNVAGYAIEATSQAAGSCIRSIVDRDGLMTIVDVATQPSVDGCPLADVVAETAAKRASEGQLKTARHPANSLAHLRACDLVDVPLLESAVPGINTNQYADAPGYACSYGDPRTTAVLVVLRLTAKPVIMDKGERRDDIAGRNTGIAPGDEKSDVLPTPHCRLSTEGPDFQGSHAEQVQIVVMSKQAKPEDLCASGEKLAQKIWPQLWKP